MAMKKRFTQEAKVQLIKEFQVSSVSANAFCKTRGLSTSSFSHWRKSLTPELKVEPRQKIIDRKKTAAGHHVDFIQVALVEPKPTRAGNESATHIGPVGNAAFEMLLPSGSMIRFAANCPPAFVTAAFAAIGVQ